MSETQIKRSAPVFSEASPGSTDMGPRIPPAALNVQLDSFSEGSLGVPKLPHRPRPQGRWDRERSGALHLPHARGVQPVVGATAPSARHRSVAAALRLCSRARRGEGLGSKSRPRAVAGGQRGKREEGGEGEHRHPPQSKMLSRGEG